MMICWVKWRICLLKVRKQAGGINRNSITTSIEEDILPDAEDQGRFQILNTKMCRVSGCMLR
ncbi:hypothetical protein MTBBW1_2620008 [Desulfamplus magnetovallimortis]|uniref:Uncharacterized protein n=1 Tax=Desulfamplus magnetovallimortis TaxID=1246637 RepID=A0A1W1HEX5_9BACT|nr:hypothetical protein MTBBW1_2620008 [Desulfamplus magnetovallimortis]